MDEFENSQRVRAIQEFRKARRTADLKALLARLTGKTEDLLVFDEVRKTLELTHPQREELKDIPLDSVVVSCSLPPALGFANA